VRLTLRTLLAYLDDTLEPAESKAIGRKIAESQTAQEIIARIREVVRRRRITAPPVNGAGAKFDANTVAEYIDNSLSAEELAEVEDTCLNSDLYLAEMAACHQILTVVISEPARVPPMARQRMYGLIRGPEAIPYRRVSRQSAESAVSRDHDQDDAEDMMLLGLPFYRSKGSWLRRLAPLAFALLAVVVAVVIWTTLPSGRRDAGPSKDEKVASARPANVQPPVETNPKIPENPAPTGNAKQPDSPEPATTTQPPTAVPPEKAQPTAAANDARYAPWTDAEPSILLQRSKGQNAWQRVTANSQVTSEVDLVSLPGCRSQVQLSHGVNLVLWGTLPGDGSPVSLFESAVELKNAPDVDLDVILERGRIGIANTKKDTNGRARVKFKNETWEFSLEPGAEVAMELSGTPGFDFTKAADNASAPQAVLALFALKGQTQVKVGAQTHTMREPPGPAVFIWTSQSGASPGAQTLATQPPWATPAGKSALAKAKPVLDELDRRLTGSTPVSDVLAAMIKEPESGGQRVAVHCLAAIDDLPMLLDLLADERAANARRTAIDGIRHWIGQGIENDRTLYTELEKKHGPASAETILHLLHGFSQETRSKPATFEYLIENLKSDKLPIRELAWMNLLLMPESAELAKSIPYDPAGGVEQRTAAYGKWKQAIPAGKMPPKTSPTAPTPAPSKK
jgi:hypothetical protein